MYGFITSRKQLRVSAVCKRKDAKCVFFSPDEKLDIVKYILFLEKFLGFRCHHRITF